MKVTGFDSIGEFFPSRQNSASCSSTIFLLCPGGSAAKGEESGFPWHSFFMNFMEEVNICFLA